MTDILQARLSPSPDAAHSEVGQETVILQLKNGTYYGLDVIGTRIWALLKEGLTPAELCRQIAEDYALDPQTVESDIRHFLEDLEANGIIMRG